MRWSSTYRCWLTSAPANGASDAALGAWTRLANYIADKELSAVDLKIEAGANRLSADNPLGDGVIRECREWSDRQWLTACGTDSTGVGQAIAEGLARWEGRDLRVGGVDLWGMHKVEKLRTRNPNGKRRDGQDEVAEKRAKIRRLTTREGD